MRLSLFFKLKKGGGNMAIRRYHSGVGAFLVLCGISFSLVLWFTTVLFAAGNVTLDGSLGPKGPVGAGRLPGGMTTTYLISESLGKKVGNNLFHSFGTFNIGTNESATFTGSAGITNIISRVTGGTPSSIDGIIRSTIDGANLFLINPSGVMFGPNASLDLKGSFHASTADYLKFANGDVFHADTTSKSVLSIAAPEAFGFLSSSTPAGISVDKSSLQVLKGQTISFVGGDFTYDSGYLNAPGGRINIASVASSGELSLKDFNISSFAKLGNIVISKGKGLDVQGSNIDVDPAGTVVIRGGKILLNDSSIYANGNPGGMVDIVGEQLHMDHSFINVATRGAVDHSGTAVNIRMTGDVLLTNGSGIDSSNYGLGRGGDVRISAGSVQLGDDDVTKSPYASKGIYGYLVSLSRGSGRTGDVYVSADHMVVKNGFLVNTAALRRGDAGNVSIHANTLSLLDGGSISSNGFAIGAAGIVDVVVKDLLISGKNRNTVSTSHAFTGLASQTDSFSKGGLLRVSADNIRLLDGGQINATVLGTKSGSNIQISAKNIMISGVVLDNRYYSPDFHAGIDARLIGSKAGGKGGNISIVADNYFQVTNGGSILTALWNGAHGDSGNISIQTNRLDINNRGVIASSSYYGSGKAGSIDIKTNDVHITGIRGVADPWANFTGVAVGTNAKDGGDLNITAGNLEMRDSAIITSGTIGTGNGGNITLKVGNMIAQNALITLDSRGTDKPGNAGNIKITAADSLMMRKSLITTEAMLADGGNIQISAPNKISVYDSKIAASVGGGPQTTGGNITIDSHYLILKNGQIVANAYKGKGGNINIAANVFLADPKSVVDASSDLGISGTVDIQAPINNISGLLAPLSTDIVSATTLLKERCIARIRKGKYSSFVIGGRDGLPIEPGNLLAAFPH